MVKGSGQGGRHYNPAIEVLLVCTGNQCRTPMAEAMLRHRLSTAGADVRVRSAGLLEGGRPATDHALNVIGARGLDLREHRSRQLSADLVAGADLIIGMARRHVREVILLDRTAKPRTFTLKELVRRAERVGPRPADTPLAGWLAALAADRQPDDLLGDSDLDDVRDPIGGPIAAYVECADELDDLLGRLTELVWPQHAEHPA